MNARRSLILSAGLCLVAAAAAHAQIRVMPGVNTGQPVAQTQAVLNNAATVGAARELANPARFYGGGGGGNWAGSPGYYPGYYGPYMGDFSLGNTLQGVSSVINAQGEFNIQNQQAKVVQQQAAQASLDTRRQKFDQMKYEQANTPTAEDLRQKAQQEELRRIRNNPPPAEVWSGAAMNTMLKTIQKEQAALGIYGPPIPLDPKLVGQLNMSGGTAMAGVGLLKTSQLEWPLGLATTPVFKDDRKKIDDLAGQLIKEAQSGRIDPNTLVRTRRAGEALREKVRGQIDELSPGDYVKAIRFTNDLAATTRSLEDPAAVNFFNGSWDAKAATVPELISKMTSKGLTFAPAATGQESAYTAMFRALTDYDTALGQMTARLQSAGPSRPSP